ncbi:hypothetical protein INR49_026599 [Caranx melampygus]|nr:hypothetical protein INR49_026599 [Caranx melampygus]
MGNLHPIIIQSNPADAGEIAMQERQAVKGQQPRLPGTSRQRKIPNMAPKVELPNAAAMVWLLVLCLIPPVEAYDTGDAIALLLGTVLAVVGFCSCLGWYARRRNEQL